MDIGFIARVLSPARPVGLAPTEPDTRRASSRGQGRDVASPVGVGRDSTGVALELSPASRARIAASEGPLSSPSVEGGASLRPSGDSDGERIGELTPEEQEEVDRLAARDAEVRAHENAHKAAAGRHARGGPSYEFERGPDGRRYAVGGEVSIDTSPVPNDPDATILKMQQVRRAALAPAEPSPQDRKVAAQAQQTERSARVEKQKATQEQPTPAVAAAVTSAYAPPRQDERGQLFDAIA